MGKRAFVRVGMPMGVLKVAAAATQLWGAMTNTAQMLTLDKVNELTQQHINPILLASHRETHAATRALPSEATAPNWPNPMTRWM